MQSFAYDRITIRTGCGAMLDIVSDPAHAVSPFYLFPEDVNVLAAMQTKDVTTNMMNQLADQGLIRRKS